MKAVLCTPTVNRPYQQYLDSVEAAIPAMDAAGIEHSIIFERDNPYISAARASMLRKALDTKPECIVFLDHDVSFRPEDLVTLIKTPGDVVGGTYRFKEDIENYMGAWLIQEPSNIPILDDSGNFKADRLPAGFLKVHVNAVEKFMRAYPELVYGPAFYPSVDLFNHGAIEGLWYGEDYAFSKRWFDKFGAMVMLQHLQIDHHGKDGTVYAGNLHEFMLRQPGGSKDPARVTA